MLDIVLLGHSVINHFERFVNEDDSRHNLGLDSSQFRIRFKGLSGLSFAQQQRLQYKEVLVRGAGIVYFDIGTNDLADQNYDPKTFARDLCSYAEYLQVGYDVQKVIIGQILFREVLPYDMFNNHVVFANEEIALRVAALPKIYFWHHRGFWNPSVSLLDHTGRYPGVHLNQEGNKKILAITNVYFLLSNAK